MKKTYIAPAIKVVKLNTERMIAQSMLGTTGLGGFGGYGGVDTGGTIVPSVKQNNGLLDNLWW